MGVPSDGRSPGPFWLRDEVRLRPEPTLYLLQEQWCWTWPALRRLSGCTCWSGTRLCRAGRSLLWCSQTCW